MIAAYRDRWLKNPVLNFAAKTVVAACVAGLLGSTLAIGAILTLWSVA